MIYTPLRVQRRVVEDKLDSHENLFGAKAIEGGVGTEQRTLPTPNSYCHPGTRRASCTCPPRISTEPLPLFFRGKSQHAGHLPNYVEMIWYHGTPDSSVVLLLVLLFFFPFGPLKGCKFDYSPIATSDFSQDIKPLKEYLLLDYKVPMPFSLKQDIFCSELWNLHFINENLKKLINVSGERLKKLIKKIYNHTKVVESCNIEVDNSSVSFVLTNISQFVDVIPFHLQSLSAKIEKITSEEKCADFKNCTVIQSQIESSKLPINTSDWKLEKKQSSQPVSHKRTYWWLLLPAILVCLIFSLSKKCQWSSSSAI
ncbi:fms-related tyrosine kinase 3 ligand [Crotalus adamanteus]|uniref:Fms-related tyrosine kinase 3 ligand n=2 Tax=Crotalus TaxID=8728 RepID=A0AAW1B5N3_CROAD